ncbi:MAG: acyl-CoA thioesterase [Rhodospirillales bacterium]|nr:acyl-CoA thioesterase [Rhodospirillales bacterium]MCW8861950.1 acyl-CoA thioesterase [Rhodospirillales bacterium]MCW8952702.1 acyl-CoA thioesterase [Rhodospirillales bacterium]MCW9002942.1 acyl-CoA thioesterase [Rhodospirillales bacterium]MCW9038919.1 acyl-CoA thioesterase [Rhodospirillales bacterium]
MTLTRSDFTYFMDVPTRWNDNDMLGHVNNVIYYSYMEAVVVRFVSEVLGVDWYTSPLIPYAAESLCRFKRPLAFPQKVEAAMRISHIGNTSFSYELALFAEGDDALYAEGRWVHVMVERESERPTPISPDIRTTLERYKVEGS